MDIIPNPSLIALQMVPFLVTLGALYFIIFKPMLDYLDAREQVIASDRAEADRLQSELADKMADYEARLTAARAQVTELRAKLRADAQAAADERLHAAHAQAEEQVAAAVAVIHQERDAARGQLEATARALGSDISARVLGRTVAVG